MSDIRQLLERQALWQKTRQSLSWPEKIQMAERIRESARLLRASAKLRQPSGQNAGIHDQSQPGD